MVRRAGKGGRRSSILNRKHNGWRSSAGVWVWSRATRPRNAGTGQFAPPHSLPQTIISADEIFFSTGSAGASLAGRGLGLRAHGHAPRHPWPRSRRPRPGGQESGGSPHDRGAKWTGSQRRTAVLQSHPIFQIFRSVRATPVRTVHTLHIGRRSEMFRPHENLLRVGADDADAAPYRSQASEPSLPPCAVSCQNRKPWVNPNCKGKLFF